MPDILNEELGRRIRQARDGKMTQGALGEQVGLSRTAITNIECGRQRVLVDQLVRIAHALGVTASDLIPPFLAIHGSAAFTPSEIEDMPTVKRWVASLNSSGK